jgi:hypothetical protein
MSEQRTLAGVVYVTKQRVTSRERVLTEMDRVILWAPLRALLRFRLLLNAHALAPKLFATLRAVRQLDKSPPCCAPATCCAVHNRIFRSCRCKLVRHTKSHVVRRRIQRLLKH